MLRHSPALSAGHILMPSGCCVRILERIITRKVPLIAWRLEARNGAGGPVFGEGPRSGS